MQHPDMQNLEKNDMAVSAAKPHSLATEQLQDGDDEKRKHYTKYKRHLSMSREKIIQANKMKRPSSTPLISSNPDDHPEGERQFVNVLQEIHANKPERVLMSGDAPSPPRSLGRALNRMPGLKLNIPSSLNPIPASGQSQYSTPGHKARPTRGFMGSLTPNPTSLNPGLTSNLVQSKGRSCSLTDLLKQDGKRPRFQKMFFNVELVKRPGGKKLGFTVVGGQDTPGRPLGIHIKTIQPDGLAAEDGVLRQGDEILEVNGISLADATHQQAVAAFKQQKKGPVNLTICRLVQSSQSRKASVDEGVSMTSVPVSPFLKNPNWQISCDSDKHPTEEISLTSKTQTATTRAATGTNSVVTSRTNRTYSAASNECERSVAVTTSGNDTTAAVSVAGKRPTSAISPEDSRSPSEFRNTTRPVLSVNQMLCGPAQRRSVPCDPSNTEQFAHKRLSAEFVPPAVRRLSDEKDAESDLFSKEISSLTEGNTNPEQMHTERLRKRSLPHCQRPRRPSTPRFMESTEPEEEKDLEEGREYGYALPGSRKGSLSLVPPSQTLLLQNKGLDEEKECETSAPSEEVPDRKSEKTFTASEDDNAIDLVPAKPLLAISKQAFATSEFFEEKSNLTTESYDSSTEAEESLSRTSCLTEEMHSISEEVEETPATHEESCVALLEQSDGSHSSDIVAEQIKPKGLLGKFSDTSAQASTTYENVGMPVMDDNLSIANSSHSLTTAENEQYLGTREHIRGSLEDQSNISGCSGADIKPNCMIKMQMPDAAANSLVDERMTLGETRRETASRGSENGSEIRRKEMEIEVSVAFIEGEKPTGTDDELQTADTESKTSKIIKKDETVNNDEAVKREWQTASGREETSDHKEDLMSSRPAAEMLMEIRHMLHKNVEMECDASMHPGLLANTDRLCDKETAAKEEDNEIGNKDRNQRDGIEDDLHAKEGEERTALEEFLNLMLKPLPADSLPMAECSVSSSSSFQPSNDDSIDERTDMGSSMTNPLLSRSKNISSSPKEELGLIQRKRTRFSFELKDNSDIQTFSTSKKTTTPIGDHDQPANLKADSITTKSSKSDNNQIPSPFDPASPNSDFFLTSDMVLKTPAQDIPRSPTQEKTFTEQPELEISETNSFDDSIQEAPEDVDTLLTSNSSGNGEGLQTEPTKFPLQSSAQRSFKTEFTERDRNNETAGEDLPEIRRSLTLDSVEGPFPQTKVKLAMNGGQHSVDRSMLLNSEAASSGKFFLTSDEIDHEIENRQNTGTQVQPVFCAEEIPHHQTIPADEMEEDLLLSTWIKPRRDSESLLVPETRDSVSGLERNCFVLNTAHFASDNVSVPETEITNPLSLSFPETTAEDLKDLEAFTSNSQTTSFASKYSGIPIPVLLDSKLAQRTAIEDHISNNETGIINGIEGDTALVASVESKFADIAPSRQNFKTYEINESCENAGSSESKSVLSARKIKLVNEEQYPDDSLTKELLSLKTSDPFHREANEFEKRSDITVGLHISDVTSETRDRPLNKSTQPCDDSSETLQHSVVYIALTEHSETGLEDDNKGTKFHYATKPDLSLKQRTQPAFIALTPTEIDIRVDQEEVDFDPDEVPPLPDSAPPTAEAMPRSPFWFQLTDEFQFSRAEGDHERFRATDINGNELLDKTLLSLQKETDANERDIGTERIEPPGEASPSERDIDETTFSSCVRIQCDSRGIMKNSFDSLNTTVEERTDSQKKLSIRFLQGIGNNIHWNLNKEDNPEHRSQSTYSDTLTETRGNNSSAYEDDDGKYEISGVGKHAPSLTLSEEDDSDRKTESGSIPIAILTYMPMTSEARTEPIASAASGSPEEIPLTSPITIKEPEVTK